MNAHDFEEWFRYHRARFPAVDTMIKKAEESVEPLTRKEIKLAWAETLRACTLSDAKAATDVMHSGLEGEPGWPDKHPAMVSAICRRASAARRQSVQIAYDGEKAVVCLECEDTGWVHCWHPIAIQEAFTTKQVERPKTCVHPCQCAAGDVRAKCFPEVPRYDKSRTCRYIENKTASAIDALFAWVATYRRPRPHNYETAFDG